MENMHLSLWDILLFPVALPLRSIGWTLTYLQNEAEKEGNVQESTWNALVELEVLKEIGEITDEDYQDQRERMVTQWENVAQEGPAEDEK